MATIEGSVLLSWGNGAVWHFGALAQELNHRIHSSAGDDITPPAGGLHSGFSSKRPKLTTVAQNTRFRALPSRTAPHFPNCCYSCSALTFHHSHCGAAVGGLVLICIPCQWWTVTIVCRFVPPVARCVCCEAARVHLGFFSLGGPSEPCSLGRDFSIGCSTLKKEVYEKEEIKV